MWILAPLKNDRERCPYATRPYHLPPSAAQQNFNSKFSFFSQLSKDLHFVPTEADKKLKKKREINFTRENHAQRRADNTQSHEEGLIMGKLIYFNWKYLHEKILPKLFRNKKIYIDNI